MEKMYYESFYWLFGLDIVDWYEYFVVEEDYMII